MAKSFDLKKYKGKFVRVDWVDIVTHLGWTEDNKDGGVHKCTSFGYVSKVRKESITISATIGTDTVVEYNQHMSIPIGCMKSIKKIKV